MEISDYERIKRLYVTLGFMSANAFADAIGLKSPQIFYDIKSGKCGISKKLARSIQEKFQEVSCDWLLTGEGDMLRNVAIIQQIGDKSNNNMQLAGTSDVVMLKKENEHLKELLQEKERTIKILMGQR